MNGNGVQAQISYGGKPLELPTLKSTDRALMGFFNLNVNSAEIERFDSQQTSDFKTFRFAYPVEVELNMNNSGTWVEVDGFRVWNLTIASPGAFSMNLIFNKFELPSGARLFISNADQTVIRGAYTAENRHRSGGFSIFPIDADQITLQYEEPIHSDISGVIEIQQIAHGYKSIMAKGNARRPLGLSGACNVNVHCDSNSPLEQQARSVCRILTKGIEFSTGTLINNTLRDGMPYVLAAFHAFDSTVVAESAVFQFQYESPGCYNIDGDNSYTLTGSTAVAWNDSSDFILLLMDQVPPPSFRPFYAGWDVSKKRPSNTHILHHPKADIKKISFDKDLCDSIDYNLRLYSYGFWRVSNWETGTTEAGSSGGALFDQNQRLVGTLTGGSATCEKLEADYFARFDFQYNKSRLAHRQLKAWLNPTNSTLTFIDGFDPYLGSDYHCIVRSNVRGFDELVVVSTEDSKQGVYTGNNSLGISEFAERFSNGSVSYVEGISLGIRKITATSSLSTATVRLYSGGEVPVTLLKEIQVNLKKLASNAMNYLPFDNVVPVEGAFFVSVVVPTDGDTLQVFQSQVRDLSVSNTLYFKQNSIWKPASDFVSASANSSALMVQVMYCGDSLYSGLDTLENAKAGFKMYPNPTSGFVNIEFQDYVNKSEVSIFDMLGKLVKVDEVENQRFKNLDLTALVPGIYFVQSDFYGSKQRFKLIVR